MSANIITGYTGERHITPAMDASVYRSAFGDDHFITAEGDKMSGSMPSINEFTVKSGVVSMQGHMIQATQETLPVDTCANGHKRIDLVVMRFTHDTNTLIDDAELMILKGVEVAEPNQPTMPVYNEGIIDSGASVVDFPLYRINLAGSSVTFQTLATTLESLDELSEELAEVVPVSRGGTGATTAATARTNLGAMQNNPPNIDFYPTATAGHGGFIDFHYNGSSSDYTSRIIEEASGKLRIVGSLRAEAIYDRADNILMSLFDVGGTKNLQFGNKNVYLYQSCKNGRMDVADSNGTYGFRWQNGASGSVWSSHADGKGALGNPSQRWNTVYAIVGTISTSDRRKKKDISADLKIYKKLLSKLTPIQFRYNDLEGDKIRFGFIAQDVEAAAQELGIDVDDVTFLMKEEIEPSEAIPDGIIYQLVYGEFIPINTALIQDLQKENEELKERLAVVEERLGI